MFFLLRNPCYQGARNCRKGVASESHNTAPPTGLLQRARTAAPAVTDTHTQTDTQCLSVCVPCVFSVTHRTCSSGALYKACRMAFRGSLWLWDSRETVARHFRTPLERGEPQSMGKKERKGKLAGTAKHKRHSPKEMLKPRGY